MKIIVNKGRVFIEEIDNGELEIFTDGVVSSHCISILPVIGTRYEVKEVTAYADTTAMLEEYKSGENGGVL